jgi:hypothetical protein
MNASQKGDLTPAQIFRCADAHFRRTGEWPRRSGAVHGDARGEIWSAVHAALEHGCRGSLGGTTLARLLKAHGRGNGRINATWTAEEDALVGSMPDAELAKRLGRTFEAVGVRRRAKSIPPHRTDRRW